MAAASLHPYESRITSELSPEMQALCQLRQLARTDNVDLTKERIAKIVADPQLDWQRMVELAERHGMTSLLQFNVALNRCSVPEVVREQLEAACRAAARKSLLLSAELLRLSEQFKAAGIRTACYKGPAMAESLYGSASMRPCSDLDFLLSVRDLAAARAALLELGYTALLALDERQQKQQARAQGALVFVNQHSSIAADLHFEIVPRHLAIALPLEPMLERAVETEFAGVKLLSLQPEDLLLVLCVHGNKHCWERLIWISDIAQILKRYPQMNWDIVQHRADNAGIRRVLLLGVTLAREMFAAELPESVLSLCLRERAIPQLMATVTKRLNAASETAEAKRWLFLLRSRERHRDRFVAMARYATTPRLEVWNGAKRIRALLPFYMMAGTARAAVKSMQVPRSNSARPV